MPSRGEERIELARLLQPQRDHRAAIGMARSSSLLEVEFEVPPFACGVRVWDWCDGPAPVRDLLAARRVVLMRCRVMRWCGWCA